MIVKCGRCGKIKSEPLAWHESTPFGSISRALDCCTCVADVEEIAKRDELIIHMHVHSGYENNGYKQMTTPQKALYDAIWAKSVAEEDADEANQQEVGERCAGCGHPREDVDGEGYCVGPTMDGGGNIVPCGHRCFQSTSPTKESVQSAGERIAADLGYQGGTENQVALAAAIDAAIRKGSEP